jgi:hypothetical protein
MKSNVNLILLGGLGVFILLCVVVVYRHMVDVAPVQACEAKGHWWDERDHICAVPVPLSTITGRRLGAPAPVAPAAPAQSPTKR